MYLLSWLSNKNKTLLTYDCIPGAYVPVTMEGNLIVDGILASCYPSFDHDVLHFGMTPLRWFPGMTEWFFGEDDGVSGYIYTLAHMGLWVFPKDVLK